MRKTMAIATVVALACGGAGFAIGAATFARADDHHEGARAELRTVSVTRPATSDAAGASATGTRAERADTVRADTVRADTVRADTVRAPIATPTPRVAGEARLEVRRLVVTRGIEAREPVDELEALDGGASLERVYAFVDAANGGDGEGVLTVTFEREGGPATGLVELEIPARAPRFRTWAFSRGVREPGAWRAVVRDESGRVLAEQPFEVR